MYVAYSKKDIQVKGNKLNQMFTTKYLDMY